MTAPVPKSDRLIAPVALALVECLRAELATSPLGPVCEVGLVWADRPYTMDGCDCSCEVAPGVTGHGHAWVRWVDSAPPAPSVNSASGARAVGSPCATGWNVVLEIGVARCIELTEYGTKQPIAKLQAEALALLGDQFALRRVLCCSVLKDQTVTVLRESPRGYGGQCAGVVLQFQLRLTNR